MRDKKNLYLHLLDDRRNVVFEGNFFIK